MTATAPGKDGAGMDTEREAQIVREYHEGRSVRMMTYEARHTVDDTPRGSLLYAVESEALIELPTLIRMDDAGQLTDDQLRGSVRRCIDELTWLLNAWEETDQ